MIVCRVVGSIVSTRKDEKLVGNKFMIVEPFGVAGTGCSQLIAVDKIGAGVGETVLVALGSAARIGSDSPNAPIDAAIIGIVDDDAGLRK